MGRRKKCNKGVPASAGDNASSFASPGEATRNIAEGKGTERELRVAQDRLRLATQAGNVGLWDWDLDSGRVYYSPEWKRQIGYEDHEIGSDFSEWSSRVHPDDIERVQRAIREYLEAPGPDFQVEFRFRHKDGGYRWILARAGIMRDQYGRPVRMLGSHVDITGIKAAEEAFKRERNFSVAILESLPGIFYCYDERRRFLLWNRNFEKVSGYGHDEIARMDPLDFFAGAERDAVKACIEEVFASGSAEIEVHLVSKDGKRTPYFFTGLAASYENRRCLLGVGIDISRRRIAEERLRISQQRLRAFAQHLQSVREEERQRIARDLHDDLGQSLAGLKMGMVWLAKHLPAGAEDCRRYIEGMLESVDEAVVSLRKLTAQLRPPVLDDLQLKAAVEWQVREFHEKTGIAARIDVPEDEITLDPGRATAVFRILQEALTNVTRHARARAVEVALQKRAGVLILEVRDDGCGFDPEKAHEHGSFGLLGMRERALLLSGSLQIESAVGKGTRLRLQLPLDD